MKEFKIDTGIPLPPPLRGGKKSMQRPEIIYPFGDMQAPCIGGPPVDSFLIELPEPELTGDVSQDQTNRRQWDRELQKLRTKVSTSQYHYRIQAGDPDFKVATRIRLMDEHGESGLRVWRMVRGER